MEKKGMVMRFFFKWLPIVLIGFLFVSGFERVLAKENGLLTAPGVECSNGSCHFQIGKATYVHGPIAVSQCLICHKPLSTTWHFFRLAHQANDLCYTCHQAEKNGEDTLHVSGNDGKCISCHDPHQSAYRFFLINSQSIRK
jgi:predicted CXXCH cytochrome family protein